VPFGFASLFVVHFTGVGLSSIELGMKPPTSLVSRRKPETVSVSRSIYART
jgi:hypothetical protein